MSCDKKACKCKPLKVKHTTPTLYFDEKSFVNCDWDKEDNLPLKVERVMVNQVGPMVHVNLYEDRGNFYTTDSPANFNFSLPVQSEVLQQSAGVVLFSTAGDGEEPAQIGTSTGDVSIKVSTYTDGTVSQTGNVVTGVGTNFLPTMVGGKIKFANGKCATIVSYVSPTSLIVSRNREIPSQTYKIKYSYARVYLIGPPLESSAFDRSQLTIDFTYITKTN